MLLQSKKAIMKTSRTFRCAGCYSRGSGMTTGSFGQTGGLFALKLIPTLFGCFFLNYGLTSTCHRHDQMWSDAVISHILVPEL